MSAKSRMSPVTGSGAPTVGMVYKLVEVDGILPRGVTAKDLVLAVIGKIGTAGGTGYAIEFAGSKIMR